MLTFIWWRDSNQCVQGEHHGTSAAIEFAVTVLQVSRKENLVINLFSLSTVFVSTLWRMPCQKSVVNIRHLLFACFLDMFVHGKSFRFTPFPPCAGGSYCGHGTQQLWRYKSANDARCLFRVCVHLSSATWSSTWTRNSCYCQIPTTCQFWIHMELFLKIKDDGRPWNVLEDSTIVLKKLWFHKLNPHYAVAEQTGTFKICGQFWQ